ncbi:SusD/RagB family nutrient-binding outer membrane lipoprotein [Hymenobacter rubidus]|uniref:SusD/RagB family nutrient-binding outer membrane lipoprotein n=1 Tax=Hymenobacter rubidus TaxID=1441626 RepID=UPI00191E7D41|nr:SusD/RagB family nutrient-binding outer membrane lipoprotein [Hymenobacter rubidus]
MKKTLILCSTALLLSATSCVDSLTDYNVDPKSATVVPGSTLVAGAERRLVREITSTNVNQNPFRLYVQYWTETTYLDESNYDYETRTINRNFWAEMYVGVLSNLKEANRVIDADISLQPAVKANQKACSEILAVYTWTVLVNTFGNVPYSEALDPTKPTPKYDDAAGIYADLFTRLDAALAALTPSAAGLGSGDLIYAGDVAKWAKFGNSLKLRMALTVADVDAATAKTKAEQAFGKTFASNTDNAVLAFTSSQPNTNPLYEDISPVFNRQDFVGTSFFINQLVTLNDPRLPYYFKPKVGTTIYVGGTAGATSAYNNNSAPGAALESPTLPGVLQTYSEVEFLLAEAVARGFTGVTGTAESHYNAAITSSIQSFGFTAASAATYLAQPAVAYTTAAGDYRQKIGTQKYYALYNNPVEAYKEVRRLDWPKITAPTSAISAFPVRLPYPTTEKNLNAANNSAAASTIGGDVVTTKIFWDKF